MQLDHDSQKLATFGVGIPDSGQQLPSVSVVIPTHDRPQFMRQAVTSVLAQDYPGRVDVVVVFDRADPEPSLSDEFPGRHVRAIGNARTPGLAGARNSGILASEGEVVAFCDDDDKWLAGKLTSQVNALLSRPESEFCTTSMLVTSDGRTKPRVAHTDTVRYADLLSSRMAMLHSSSFLMWRGAVTDGFGLVDEMLPRSMAEDWDLLLRAARRHPILHVDRPLIEVRWGATSYFADQWAVRKQAQLYLMERYPEKLADPAGAALSYGKLAFGDAAQGQRRSALRWASKAFRSNWREPRIYLACAVAVRIVSPSFLLRQLNKRGHGI